MKADPEARDWLGSLKCGDAPRARTGHERLSQVQATGLHLLPAALACVKVSIGSDTTVQPGSRGGLPLSWRVLAGGLVVVAIAVVAALLLSGGGHSAPARAKTSIAQAGTA